MLLALHRTVLSLLPTAVSVMSVIMISMKTIDRLAVSVSFLTVLLANRFDHWFVGLLV